jgi:hypothetical protein
MLLEQKGPIVATFAFDIDPQRSPPANVSRIYSHVRAVVRRGRFVGIWAAL